MTYIVINENEIVKAEMERSEDPFGYYSLRSDDGQDHNKLWVDFEKHCLSLPRIPIKGKHKWEVWQEVELDKDFELKPARTWTERNGEYGCAECCNRDRCDEDCDATYYRPNCPYCKGKGWFKEIPVIAIPIQPTPEGEKVEETKRVLLLTSYCGDEGDGCTSDFPCDDCLKMCNVVTIKESSILENLGGFDYNKFLLTNDNTQTK